ncbi:MAG: carbohydrate binding family 9 domain-containing protein, partial [Gramella sp.]|nr:carbohydrate binding family 9 domain-containing protein [Christiangramia sp.]
MPFRFYILFFLLINYHLTYSQSAQKERRSYTTQRIDNPPKIDGVINDEAWSLIDAQGEFVMVEPGDGDPIDNSHETRIKILYDNEAIYIAGIMLEEFPERIMKQFTQRDNLNQSEFFVVDINTYDDGENQTRFIVTAAGTQADARMTGNREDFGYNVVWESAVSEDDKGWYVEMKIPYAALRFPDKETQLWGIQFYRDIKHLNSRFVWNYIDKSLGQPSQYTGLLKGISDIDPPVRLSLYPYTSTILDQFDGNTDINFNAGLDLKYGINDSFTLDMTLVPDFGQ